MKEQCMKTALRVRWRKLARAALAVAGLCCVLVPGMAQSGELELRLLHVNDTHAFLAGSDAGGNACFASEACRGGLGRIAAAIRQARAEQDNVIALDAGDQFQGTLFYSIDKWPVIAAVDRLMPYDAMTLGNHEFDDGCAALASFLAAQPLPVVAANLKPGKGCPLSGSRIRPYVIREIRGVRVGIVGLANDGIGRLPATCPQTAVSDAQATLEACVRELEAQGIRHIIVLTHLGLERDRALARAVSGVDVIVGGHSHSYLGKTSPEGPYPVVEHAPDGSPVLVVTAGRAARLLGDLTVVFDAAGVARRWSGEARELTPSLPVAEDVERVVADAAGELETYRTAVIGRHAVRMPDGMEQCRAGECFAGMVLVDAMLEYGRPEGAAVALYNSGGVRAALPPGSISRGDVLTAYPFGGEAQIREYTGEQLRQALEHGLAGKNGAGPHLLQVAGLRYEADVSRPAGSRLLSVDIVNEEGRTCPLDPQALYVVVLGEYLTQGGDGFQMLKEGRLLRTCSLKDQELVEAYIRRHSPLPPPETGRIRLLRKS